MKVLILNNTDTGMLSTRMELIDTLLERKHEVVLNFPITASTEIFENKGCKVSNIELSRRGKNPFKELKLLKAYKKLIKQEKPDVVFASNIKPNVYGGMAYENYPMRVKATSNRQVKWIKELIADVLKGAGYEL